MNGPTPLNADEFVGEALARNLDRALGRQPDGSLCGGLHSAAVVDLPVGARLCRIGNSALPARMNIASPWWVTEDTFVTFLKTSLAADRDLRELIRDSLALSTDFMTPNAKADEIRARYGDEGLRSLANAASIMPWNRVFTVEVTAPVRAFRGVGRDVPDTADDTSLAEARTWRAASDVDQLVIPGLMNVDDRGLSAMGRQALHFRRSHSLTHWREWILDDLEKAGANSPPAL